MTWAIVVSLAAHAALLTVRFVDPEAFNRVFKDTPLEVVLVSSRSDERPFKAQVVAQSSLAGGGDADKGLSSTPLPPSATVELGDSAEDARRKIQQLQEVQAQMLADMRKELASLPPADPAREVSTAKEREQDERRKHLQRQLAIIDKRVQEENARPKKRYVSPATQEAVYAMYYDSWRRKVEERGTRDFPENQGKRLYGELVMNVTIDAQGRVIETDIKERSHSRVLDRRAIAIVQASAPYGNFNAAMRKEADQIVMTAQFRFTRDDVLEATPMASQR